MSSSGGTCCGSMALISLTVRFIRHVGWIVKTSNGSWAVVTVNPESSLGERKIGKNWHTQCEPILSAAVFDLVRILTAEIPQSHLFGSCGTNSYSEWFYYYLLSWLMLLKFEI